MELKKTLFGGYQKVAVNKMIQQWEEDEDKKQAQITMLENEIKASKEVAQKNLETVRMELELKEQTILSERKEISDKQETIYALEARLGEQGAVVRNLEEKMAENLKVKDQYNESIRQIGQLYVDAKIYSDSLKEQARKETGEMIDQMFADVSKSKEEYVLLLDQINQNNQSMTSLTDEMTLALKTIRDNLTSMSQDSALSNNPYDQMEQLKSRMQAKIIEDIQPTTSQSTITQPIATQESVPIPIPDSVENIPAPPIPEATQIQNDIQISELKQMIEQQKQLLEQMKEGQTVSDKLEKSVDEITKNEKIEDYNKYFAEIEKKYLKNQNESFMIDIPSADVD